LRIDEGEMAAQKKSLTSQQQKLILDLEEKLKRMPEWPYYATLFQYHQYDRLSLQVSQTMIFTTLDRQNAFEEKLKLQMAKLIHLC
jgi:hypothetical protein